MSAYYVTHPMMDKTAVVYAPSTEKARTTFLDWLERNGLMDRRQRQVLRRDMIAKRLEDPNIPVDVELNYGYEGEPQVDYRLGRGITIGGDLGGQEAGNPAIDLPVEIESMEPPISITPQSQQEGPRPRRMPIQEVMLGGFGG